MTNENWTEVKSWLDKIQAEAGDRMNVITPKAKPFNSLVVCKNCGDKYHPTNGKNGYCNCCIEYCNIEEQVE